MSTKTELEAKVGEIFGEPFVVRDLKDQEELDEILDELFLVREGMYLDEFEEMIEEQARGCVVCLVA